MHPARTLAGRALQVDRLLARPRPLLVGLVFVQWLAILAFALTVKHNGWLYHQNGDQLWYTTTGWLLGHGQLPPTHVGYWWAMVLAPVMLATGREFLGALPVVVLFDVLVLGPVALFCVYSIASRIGGRLLGFWSAALWVAVPFAAIPLFRHDYHERYVEQLMPQMLGLTAMADFPSMVCLLVSSAILLRALERRAPIEAVLAGLAAGVAAGVKPANLLFLAGPALAILASRRLMLALPFVAALAPALLALAIWKDRGLGSISAFTTGEVHDWDNLHSNMSGLREWFWSARLLQWLPFAGLLAVARRSLPAAGLLGGWFFAFLLVRGSTPLSSVATGSFFRLLLPAFPAFFLLAASVPLLVPTLASRLAREPHPATPATGRRTVAVVAAVLVVVPFAAATLPRPISSTDDAIVVHNLLVPVDPGIDVEVSVNGEARILTWHHPSTHETSVFYRVFRTRPARPDAECRPGGAIYCDLHMLELETTRARTYVDGSPPPGARYRIGVVSNWRNDPEGGDIFAVSPPVAATPGS